MKTSLACIGILIGALLIGRWQGARIENLERRFESTKASRTMKASHRVDRENHSNYRTKYARRGQKTTAGEVFARVVRLAPRPGGNELGINSAMQYREEMQAILQLDLKGIGELMSLVYQSEELAKTRPMQHIAATLCLIAMVDSSPDAALTHMTASKEWNRLFSPDHLGDDNMVGYVLARMAEEDPNRALDSMWKLENTPKALSADSIGSLLGKIARHDPALALDSMRKLENTPKALSADSIGWLLQRVARRDPALALDVMAELPDADSERTYQMISSGIESDNERTALFLAIRDRLDARPAEMKEALTSLSRMFSFEANLPAESRKWADGLGMTDAEKLLMAEGLKRITIHPAEGEDYTRWFASFMPESQERIELIWVASREWESTDPVKSSAFLKEQGIDPDEMHRREMERTRASLKERGIDLDEMIRKAMEAH